MKFHATVAVNNSIIEYFSIYELERHFREHEVIFRGINYSLKFSSKNIGVSLSGSKEKIRKAVKNLYETARRRMHGIETEPARFVPEKMKHYLETLADDEKYQKLYKFCVDDYMQNNQGQALHPELDENFKTS